MNKLYSEIIFEMYLDFVNNYLTVEKFAENNLLSAEHAKQIIGIGRQIAKTSLQEYQQNQI
jgi:hypothetical protein